MAKFNDNTELAALIKKYSRDTFVPYILPPTRFTPRARTYEDTLNYVRKISENAVNRIYAS